MVLLNLIALLIHKKTIHTLCMYNLMSLDMILFSSAGKHGLRRICLEFSMAAYLELNSVVIKG